ncbi:hypothetical protein MDMS009_2002 [Methylophaga thiooxydans DMS010]|uniref:Uncharacterized protein n=1 Tax=Methylophaga thiooxydans DMS010 TaxID=637616 RepID=C0N7G5_9GAMM|nr:hypothetical protein MDMS009_2002 [Methylophaga thiooxydans DMS010]
MITTLQEKCDRFATIIRTSSRMLFHQTESGEQQLGSKE